MKNWIFSISIILFMTIVPVKAQELNCTVTVNSDQIQGTNKQVFNSLQNVISEFMNSQRWTEMSFATEERIDCSINIIVSTYNVGDGKFEGVEFTVQSRRPVYGSNYNTTILNLRDTEVDFIYQESDRLEFIENMVSSNLTSLLAYYAYIIIGYDTDTYARLGGTPYFQKAENIVLSGQSSDYSGWQAYKGKALRYTLANNLMDEAFKKFRNYLYEYHRLGLDQMVDNTTNARARIAEGLPIVRDANRARPSGMIVTAFMDAKSDELVNIFSEGSTEQKQAVYEVLTDIAPTRTNQFEAIIKN